MFSSFAGTTNFFHNNDFYEFHDDLMTVRRGPKNLNRHWLRCKKPVIKQGDEGQTEKQAGEENSGMSVTFGGQYGSLYCIGFIAVLLSNLFL